MVLFYVQHGLGVFRHLGGDPQHIPVGKRRAANLCLTSRLVLCYNIPSGGCAGLDWLPHEGGGCAGFDWLPHLFYWINIIQILYTVCGFRHVHRGLPDGVIFILNVRRPTASRSCRSALMRASSCTPTSDTSCWSAPLPNLLNSFGWRTGSSAPRRLSAVILCSARRSRVSSTGSRREN